MAKTLPLCLIVLGLMAIMVSFSQPDSDDPDVFVELPPPVDPEGPVIGLEFPSQSNGFKELELKTAVGLSTTADPSTIGQLTGCFVIGRGVQVLSWTHPNTNDKFRLYLWTEAGSLTNVFNIPSGANRILLSGVAGAGNPTNYAHLTVISNGIESEPSNLITIEP